MSLAKKNGYQIIALEITKKSIQLKKLKIKGKVCLIVGNEVSGVAEDAISASDVVTHIPMKGIKNSLNVTNAFAIAAYKLTE